MKKLFLLFVVLLLLTPIASMAQDPGAAGVDWAKLGVDAVLVGVIVGAVQIVKKNFMKSLPAVYPFIATVILSIIAGIAKNYADGLDFWQIVQIIFGYASAAIFLYEGLKSFAKSGLPTSVLSISLIALVLICGNGNAQAPMNDYDALWNANTPQPGYAMPTHYELYFWEGADTTLAAQISNFQRVGLFEHDSLLAIYPSGVLRATDVYPSEKNGEYLVAALRAFNENSATNPWSAFAFSNAYRKADERPVQQPVFAAPAIQE